MDKKEKWLNEILQTDAHGGKRWMLDEIKECSKNPNPIKKEISFSTCFTKLLLDGTIEKYFFTLGLVIGNIILLAVIYFVGELGLNLLSSYNEMVKGLML